jgi:hypothetical protein
VVISARIRYKVEGANFEYNLVVYFVEKETNNEKLFDKSTSWNCYLSRFLLWD